MLRTNLSTRPFYNERAAQIALGVAGAAARGVHGRSTSCEWRSLSGAARGSCSARVGDDERAAATLRNERRPRAAQRGPRASSSRVAAAAREANGLIDRRAFSWTDLLNRLEATLPPNVRVRVHPARRPTRTGT